MQRPITVAAAQLGPIARSENRTQVVKRLLELMRQAHEFGCDLVVFPELALTTFFPRWYMEDQDEIDSFFEQRMPGNETQPLFENAKALGIGFYLGYAELTRTGLSAPIQSSSRSGNIVLWLRSTPSTKRFIKPSRQSTEES